MYAQYVHWQCPLYILNVWLNTLFLYIIYFCINTKQVFVSHPRTRSSAQTVIVNSKSHLIVFPRFSINVYISHIFSHVLCTFISDIGFHTNSALCKLCFDIVQHVLEHVYSIGDWSVDIRMEKVLSLLVFLVWKLICYVDLSNNMTGLHMLLTIYKFIFVYLLKLYRTQ